jgi:hypothetical protein
MTKILSTGSNDSNDSNDIVGDDAEENAEYLMLSNNFLEYTNRYDYAIFLLT